MSKKKTGRLLSPGGLLSLTLILVLLISAASVPVFAEQADAAEIDLAALTEANSFEHFIRNHTSIATSGVYYDVEGGILEEQTLYYSQALIANHLLPEAQLLYEGMSLTITEDYPDIITATLYVDEEDYLYLVSVYQEFFDNSFETESLVSASREDGLLHVVMQGDEDIARRVFEDMGLEFQEGDKLLQTYVFAEDTLEWQSGSASVIAGGEEILYFDCTVVYDTEYDRDASPFAAALDAGKTRKVTVVYAPGTDAEKSRTFDLSKAVGFWVYVDGDYWTDPLYTDPACTQVYEGSDPNDYSDIVFYLPARDAA